MSENKKSDRDTNREVDDKWSTREAIDIFNSRYYHKVTVSSRKGYDLSSLW